MFSEDGTLFARMSFTHGCVLEMASWFDLQSSANNVDSITCTNHVLEFTVDRGLLFLPAVSPEIVTIFSFSSQSKQRQQQLRGHPNSMETIRMSVPLIVSQNSCVMAFNEDGTLLARMSLARLVKLSGVDPEIGHHVPYTATT